MWRKNFYVKIWINSLYKIILLIIILLHPVPIHSANLTKDSNNISKSSEGGRSLRSLMEKAHHLFGNMMYKSEIPGMAGKDYPIYADIPETNFHCTERMNAGYYADVEAGCQVIHVCQAEGAQESFLCPNGTIFNQQYFVCDWWFNVNCQDSPTFYDLNGGFGKPAEKNYYQEPTEKVAEKDYFQESRLIERRP